jgi:hypothetical protein
MNNAAVNNASALFPRALRRRVEELFAKAIQKAQTPWRNNHLPPLRRHTGIFGDE